MGNPRRKEKKEAKKEKKRLKKMGASPLNKPEDPFFIDDRTQEELSRKQYFDRYGTNKYTQTAIDRHLDGSSSNKRRRKRTRIKKH